MPHSAPHLAEAEPAVAEVLQDAGVEMLARHDYPCLGAQSVVRGDRLTVRVYEELDTPAAARLLLQDLRMFDSEVDLNDGFASFIAVFRGPQISDEQHFERILWSQLRRLHEVDDEPWNDQVSRDPEDEHFAFSVAGSAYFVVGMHPTASRDARRAANPTLVFNPHEQFTTLRASGHFLRMRDLIRDRDRQFQGTINPMVSDHGATSEARQYSGREVGRGWQAPFEHKDS